MNVLIFGASGMLGQGLLRECLAAPDVSRVTTMGRSPSGAPAHPKLTEQLVADLATLSDAQLRGPFDACFFVIGVTSSGLDGARSKTTAYRLFYQLFGPLMPLARWLAPRTVLSTEIIGQAMLNIVRHGAPKPLLETADIWAAAQPL